MEIDFDGIELGGEIPQALCETHLTIRQQEQPERYALALLKLLQEVRKYLKTRHGREITVRAVKHGLLILDDREAAAYNPKRYADGLRIARRAHRRLMAVDVSKLTPEERTKHGRAVERQGAQLLMMRDKPKDIPVPAVKRATPKLFGQT